MGKVITRRDLLLQSEVSSAVKRNDPNFRLQELHPVRTKQVIRHRSSGKERTLWNCHRSERRNTLCIPIEFIRGSSMIRCKHVGFSSSSGQRCLRPCARHLHSASCKNESFLMYGRQRRKYEDYTEKEIGKTGCGVVYCTQLALAIL
jgi:hypothetical protein